MGPQLLQALDLEQEKRRGESAIGLCDPPLKPRSQSLAKKATEFFRLAGIFCTIRALGRTVMLVKPTVGGS